MKRRPPAVALFSAAAFLVTLAAVPTSTAAPVPTPRTIDTPTFAKHGLLPTSPADALADEEVTVTRRVARLAGEKQVITYTRIAVGNVSGVEFTVPSRVDVDQRIPLAGQVKVKTNPEARRPVSIQQRVDGSWRTIWKGRAARDTGKFSLEFPGVPQPMLVKLRAKVAKSDGLPAATSPAYVLGIGTAEQVAELKIMDTAKDWTWQDEDHSVWSGCNLDWAYKSAGGYTGALNHLKKSVAAVDAQSAFTFTKNDSAADADITVEWASPKTEPALKGNSLGIAWVTASNGEIVVARVILDKTENTVKKKFNGEGMTWGSVMMHEMAHTQGMGHAAGKKQVMYPASVTGTWGKGDKAGLAQVSDHCAS